LLPNYKLPDLEDKSIDVFYNFHSLSEMEFPTIDEYIQQIGRTTKLHFFHENSVEKKI
jgi:putative sugar O-methyltransferase